MGELKPESDIVVIPNKRKVTSIFVDPLIWKAFKHKCRNRGTSTCSILEPFMYAFCKAVPDTPVSPLPVVNVTLHISRVVQRVHRLTKDGYEVGKSQSYYAKHMRVLHPDGTYDK